MHVHNDIRFAMHRSHHLKKPKLHVHSKQNNNCPRPLEAFEDPHEESVVEGVQHDVRGSPTFEIAKGYFNHEKQ